MYDHSHTPLSQRIRVIDIKTKGGQKQTITSNSDENHTSYCPQVSPHREKQSIVKSQRWTVTH